MVPHPENQLAKILGTTNKDLNAPHAIWSFFKQLKNSKSEKTINEKVI